MARVHKKHKSFYSVLPIIIVILVLLIVIPKVIFKIDMLAVIWSFVKSCWFVIKNFLYILLGICVVAYLYYLFSGKAAKEKQELEENRIALEEQKAMDHAKMDKKFIEPAKQCVKEFKMEHSQKEKQPLTGIEPDNSVEQQGEAEKTMNLF